MRQSGNVPVARPGPFDAGYTLLRRHAFRLIVPFQIYLMMYFLAEFVVRTQGVAAFTHLFVIIATDLFTLPLKIALVRLFLSHDPGWQWHGMGPPRGVTTLIVLIGIGLWGATAAAENVAHRAGAIGFGGLAAVFLVSLFARTLIDLAIAAMSCGDPRPVRIGAGLLMRLGPSIVWRVLVAGLPFFLIVAGIRVGTDGFYLPVAVAQAMSVLLTLSVTVRLFETEMR